MKGARGCDMWILTWIIGINCSGMWGPFLLPILVFPSIFRKRKTVPCYFAALVGKRQTRPPFTPRKTPKGQELQSQPRTACPSSTCRATEPNQVRLPGGRRRPRGAESFLVRRQADRFVAHGEVLAPSRCIPFLSSSQHPDARRLQVPQEQGLS